MLAEIAVRISSLVWLGIALIAAIIEVSIPHFGSMFIAAGAVAAAAVSYVGYGVAPQIAGFAVVLVASFAFLRSKLVAWFGEARGVPTRTAPLVGRDGIVTHDIDPARGTGRVTVGGEDWAARSPEQIASGTKIRVVGADGIVLEVTRV